MAFKAGLLARARGAAHIPFMIGTVAALASSSLFAASSVTLAWDPCTSTNIAGYKVHYGPASRTYTNTLTVGNATRTTITNLISGTTYYFTATAYDTDNLESDFSNEVSYTPAGSACVLSVASSNPGSGVAITVSPSDNNGQGNGATPFTRSYNNNTVVSLTAPATAGANPFQKWQKDGVDWATSVSTSVTMDAVPHADGGVWRKCADTGGRRWTRRGGVG